jgi:nucleotide-binding universal stress UspA family protein
MVFLVPYDGSRVAQAALDCAVRHGEALDEQVVAVSFVPTGSEYAQRRKWIEPADDFAVDTAREELERKIQETVDDSERPYAEPGASAPHNGVTADLRQVADEVGASVLFVGTEETANGDELTTPFGPIVSDGDYDIHLVQSV